MLKERLVHVAGSLFMAILACGGGACAASEDSSSLCEDLFSTNVATRQAAEKALLAKGPDGATALFAYVRRHPPPFGEREQVVCLRTLAKFGPTAVDGLFALSERTDGYIYKTESDVAVAMVSLLGKPSLAPIGQRLKHKQPGVRSLAARLLEGAHIDGCTELLRGRLDDEDDRYVIGSIVAALCANASADDPVFGRMLSDPRPAVRSATLRSIPPDVTPKYSQELTKCFGDDDRLVRYAAVKAAADAGLRAHLPSLLRACSDKEDSVRQAALLASAQLGDRASQLALTSEFDRAVDPDQRVNLAIKCASFGHEPSVKFLIGMVDDSAPPGRALGRGLLSGSMVRAIAKGRTKSGEQAILRWFPEIYEDWGALSSTAVLRYLATQRPDAVRPLIAAIAVNAYTADDLAYRDSINQERMCAISLLSDVASVSVSNAVVLCLRDQNPLVVLAAARVARRFPRTDALITALRECSDSPFPAIRQACQESIRSLESLSESHRPAGGLGKHG